MKYIFADSKFYCLIKNQIQMKKFYSLISAALLGSVTTFGQVAMGPVHKNHVAPSGTERKVSVHNSGSSSERIGNPQNNTNAIIWSDDFSNASNWVISNDAGNSDDWVIGTNGPSGTYFIDPIASTSAANGFALYDSDLMCSGDQIGNLTNATAINCTGHPTVRVRFQEYYRRFLDSTYVYASNDGVNWTLFPVNPTLAVNAFVATNPTELSVDITSVAGNQATVYIRFTFYSPSSLGTGAGCAYSWMVDDVVVEDLPSDDVAMVASFPSVYTVVPFSQSQTIDLAAQIANIGLNTETNVGFDAFVLVYDYSSGTYLPVANATSAPAASLNAGDTTPVLSAGPFNPADTGFYAFVYISHMDNTDADESNDTSVSFYYVSDTTYARDNSAIAGGNADQVIQYNAGGSGSFAQMYEAFTSVTITSVSTIFFSHTVGDQLTVSIYSMNGGVPDQLLGSSPTFTTTGADTGGVFMTFELDPPVYMNAGQFAASIDQLTTDPIGFWMNDDIHTPGTTFFGTTGSWGLLDTVGISGGSAFFPQTFAIRPNLQLNTAVKGLTLSSNIDIFPNPSNGKVFIHNSGQKENMTVTVFNNVGQIVYSDKFTQMSTAVVDLTAQAGGVYTVQVKSDKDVTTKSIVISNK
jgi:hypothetical protein